ncbi:MAG: polyphosphate polymerase domain-containing protein [Lachnospiraceae bacterium]|nr:polyphosphate polymerase domain-containing protein [Lachnospiraceae bacterium]
MSIEVFNRYEQKYMIPKNLYEDVLKKLDGYMVLDEHNKEKSYTISNIYFDTDDDYLIRESLEKPKYKEKLRLRSYGVYNMDSKVFLEIKKKYNGLVNKRRTTLKLGEAYSFTSTGKKPALKPYMNPQVLNEIEYFLKIYDLSPKLYLAYDRVAFFGKEDGNLRISFDEKIRSRRTDLRLEHGDYGDPVINDDMLIMEIKTPTAQPLWLTHMLSEMEIRKVSFSKYGTEYKNYICGMANEKVYKMAM